MLFTHDLLTQKSLSAGSCLLRRCDRLHRVAGEHQDLPTLDQRPGPGRKRLAPLELAHTVEALHRAVGEQVEAVVLCPDDLAGREHATAVTHGQLPVQQHRRAGLAIAQQQGRTVTGVGHADEGAAAKIVAGAFACAAAARVVQHGAVLIKHQQKAVGHPAHPLGHTVLGAKAYRVALREGQYIKVRGQLAAHRRYSGHGKAAAVRRKGHAQRGALLTGQVPHQLLLHTGIVNGQLCHAVGAVGHHSHLSGICHGAQRDGAVHGFGIKVLGAAFHPKLIAGAVVQHKAGLACSNGRAGIAALDAVQAGAAKTVYHAAVAAHLHKAARHLRHRIRVGDAGLLRPACGWCQRDDGSIHKVFCARNGRPHCAGGKQDKDGQHRYDDDGAADAPCAHPGPGGFQIFDASGRKRLPFGGMSAAANFAHEWFSLQIILHTLQKQALGGQGRPGAAAVTAFQNGGNFRRVQPACTRFAQSARQNAHHVVQVAVGGHFNVDLVPLAGNMTVRDGAHGIAMGCSGRARRAQGQKIVPAHELLRRRLHSGFVQMPGHPGVISRVKRRVDGVVVDAVEVGFGMGRVPGMEILRHHLRVQHPDVRRQMLVERQRELCRRDAGIGVEVELEAQRVHPCIGAAAALDIGAAVQHGLQRVLKGLGHAAAIGLHLKAAVIGAVVGKGK